MIPMLLKLLFLFMLGKPKQKSELFVLKATVLRSEMVFVSQMCFYFSFYP